MAISQVRGIVPGRSWRGRSTLFWSVDDALDEFRAAPALAPRDETNDGRRGWTNEALIVAVCGVRAVDVRDKALYDAASLRYDVRCLTFKDAFRACATAYDRFGHRDWREVDIETLRSCHVAWRGMQLPTWVQEMLLDEAVAELDQAEPPEFPHEEEVPF